MPQEVWTRENSFEDSRSVLDAFHQYFGWRQHTEYVHRFWGNELVDSWRGMSVWTATRKVGRLQGGFERLRKMFRDLDSGHSFRATRHEYRDNSPHVSPSWSNAGWGYDYSGKLYAAISDQGPKGQGTPGYPIVTSVSPLEMIGAGTIAIERCAPASPAADAAVLVAETVRDLPQIPLRGFVKNPSLGAGAGEFLNWKFGIEPTISDTRKLLAAVRNSAELIKQLERDSGRRVRRSYSFPEQTEEKLVLETVAKPLPAISGSPWDQTVKLEKWEITKRKFWFSGSFTYYLSAGDSAREKIRRYVQLSNSLYGASFTPGTVWALTPFSWLADWYGTVGEVISNFSNFAINGTVMHYGYIMCQSSKTVKYVLRSSAIPTIGFDLVQEFTTVEKQRMRATPYGFGLDPSTFSDQQWAILTALGISQGSNRLNPYFRK